MSPLSESEYEQATISQALEGDVEAGMEALRLFVFGSDTGNISPALLRYVADRIAEIAIEGKRPDIALRIHAKRKRGPEYDHTEIAATYYLLLQEGYLPEKAKQVMQENVFNQKQATTGGVDRRTIERIAKDYAPTKKLPPHILLHMTGTVRKKVAPLIPNTLRQIDQKDKSDLSKRKNLELIRK